LLLFEFDVASIFLLSCTVSLLPRLDRTAVT